MKSFLVEQWVYVLLALSVIAVLIYSWVKYRVWLWENIFGVAFVHCIVFSIPSIRVKIADLVNVELINEGPHWTITVTSAVLHYLTVNRRKVIRKKGPKVQGPIANNGSNKEGGVHVQAYVVGSVVFFASIALGFGIFFSLVISYLSGVLAAVYNSTITSYVVQHSPREVKVFDVTLWRTI